MKLKTPRAFALLLISLFVVPLVITAPALAGGAPEEPEIVYIPSVPNPTPAYVGHAAGYVWEELVGHAHVVVNADAATSLVSLSWLPVDTKVLDVEVTGLPRGLSESMIYTLDGGTNESKYHYMGAVGRDGKAVFWGVLPTPMTLALTDPAGVIVKTIGLTFDPRELIPVLGPVALSNAASTMNTGNVGCDFSGDYGSCEFYCSRGDDIFISASDTDNGPDRYPRTHATCGGVDIFCQERYSCEAVGGPTDAWDIGRCFSETVSNNGSCIAQSPSWRGTKPVATKSGRGEPVRTPNDGGPSCYGPCPTRIETTTGETINQGAIANTVAGQVTTTGCWGHTFGASAKVSGGQAAQGTAGTTYTYSRSSCSSVHTNGHPVKAWRDDEFERTWYADGSYRAYAKGDGEILTIESWNVAAICTSGGTDCFETFVTNTCDDYLEYSNEQTSGSVTLGAGWSVLGWGVEGGLSITATQDSQVRYEVTHPDCAKHTWHRGALAGDPRANSGLIGVLQEA